MTEHEARRPAPASGMRAEHDDRTTAEDAGWPRHTEAEEPEEPEATEEPGSALEERADVRRAIDDDTSVAELTGYEPQDEDPLDPEFRAPTDDGA
ncbi:hypothetical protein [Streptomyces galbus]|uniref:DUF5709 domain-containing protein n=1 Tax=Streptomyces galbus TaxID=33898 RepID=A0A4U5X0C4_STRGB|nr:hypothetical protein [Streptomyces galbus]TKT08080.1 hypothetical protein E4U92_18925 [Streptomyces galbus]GHD42637.1 hypothetical protein GCM10010335_45770 [Streptomyces galbus]